MNLYLVFALALGAISAAPVPRPDVVRVAAQTRAVAQRPVPFAVCPSPFAVTKALGERPAANGERLIAEVPLTGAATPRAPARTC